jgi:hypothetical protein
LDRIYFADWSVESIEESAFENCTSLEGLSLPEGLKYIGPRAFKGCTSLEWVQIPGSVEYIDAEAFSGCCNLVSLGFAPVSDDTLKHKHGITEDGEYANLLIQHGEEIL